MSDTNKKPSHTTQQAPHQRYRLQAEPLRRGLSETKNTSEYNNRNFRNTPRRPIRERGAMVTSWRQKSIYETTATSDILLRHFLKRNRTHATRIRASTCHTRVTYHSYRNVPSIEHISCTGQVTNTRCVSRTYTNHTNIAKSVSPVAIRSWTQSSNI